MSDREFLFNYRFAGSEWGITIHAADAAEAKEKIKQVALARYEGEVAAKIPASPRSLWRWLGNAGRAVMTFPPLFSSRNSNAQRDPADHQ